MLPTNQLTTRKRRSRYRYAEVPDLTRRNLEPPSLAQQATRSIVHTNSVVEVNHPGTNEFQGAQHLVTHDSNDNLSHLSPLTARDSGQHYSSSAESVGLQDERQESDLDRSDPTDSGDEDICGSISDWRVLWALIATNGTNNLTKLQYQSLRNLFEVVLGHKNPVQREYQSDKKRIGLLPHYSTLHRKYRRILFNRLLPKPCEVQSEIDRSRPGVRASRSSSTAIEKCTVPLILPSQYACMDMATGPVWSLMKANSLLQHSSKTPSISTSECVDTIPLVAGRKWFFGPRTALFVDEVKEGIPSFAEIDDVVDVSFINASLPLAENVLRSFGSTGDSGMSTTLRGILHTSWTVHHTKRRGDPLFAHETASNLCQRDAEIVKRFGYVSYTSPSDSVRVLIPDLPVETVQAEEQNQHSDYAGPSASSKRRKVSSEMSAAVKARQAAIRKRKMEVEAAWRGWTKPILKPGDFVVMLRPCTPTNNASSDAHTPSPHTMLTASDRSSRLCIVSRFWAERGERSRHAFFVPGGTNISSTVQCDALEDDILHSCCAPLTQSSPVCFLLDIRCVSLTATHTGPRGYAAHTPVSSVGTLSTGEHYFFYRFVLFWDGFEIQAGKSASGEGFYLVPLNLPMRARSSPNATPPGVKGYDVLMKLLEEVEHGMTDGFLDYDANGTQRRVFLDLVGFVGDTPALNQYLDVLGHTASACCHLCRYVRGPATLLGSRYSRINFHGLHSHLRRGMYQHCGVRDCGASAETLRQLGITSAPSPTARALLQFQVAFFSTRNRIPMTSTGFPVVSHFLDAYRACLVGPDHLLTGHFRDCVSLALRLLPSRGHRETCERFMLRFLSDAGLPLQNRLVDHDKKALLAMSMSDIYALAIVAEQAFIVGCAREDRVTPNSSADTSKCRAAVGLVGSCAELIAGLCFFPSGIFDGMPAVQSYEAEDGERRMSNIQKLMDAHLEKITQICHMNDSEVVLLEDPNCSQRQKADLLKIERTTLLAIKTIDNPNVHRLLELVRSTLPMVGHISLFGELVFEKNHQLLKRAIKNSNNKQIQWHSLRCATFNDWQGRVSLLAPGAIYGSTEALRGCFRFIFGTEALASASGCPTKGQCDDVIRAFGPDGFLVRELLSQGRSVLSPRGTYLRSGVGWSLHGATDTLINGSAACAVDKSITKSLKTAFVDIFDRYVVLTGERALYKNLTNIAGVTAKHGTLLQVLCYKPDLKPLHYPLLVQFSCMDKTRDWMAASGPSLWCVVKFVCLVPEIGHSILYAAVYPCAPVRDQAANAFTHDRHRVISESKISFAKLDDTIRVVGSLHSCFEFGCELNTQDMSILHGEDPEPLSGATFLPLTRRNGYPPRRG